ncbi:MAG: alkaline phosphatase family protein, partial [Candidatus Marinimicrobia bacterium]|nr:alkaline phosphatase family protein [Candidatus Neomarinimicrobiota bacterium]
ARRFFGLHPWRPLSTVCPATTAAAVTTFATGASPREHGITGWHVNLPDLGLVSTILPGVTRLGQPAFGPKFKLKSYLGLPSHLDSTRRRRLLLSYGEIPWSAYSRVGTRWGARWGYETLGGLERRLQQALRVRPPALIYAYWPEYDSLCHEHGSAHPAARRHLEALDALLARLAERVAETRATVLITADHGLVDVAPEQRRDLADLPGLMNDLATAPAGDARQVFLYVRPGRLAALRRRLRAELRELAVVLDGDWLTAQGVFGPGEPHPAWPQRIGDLVLLARDGCAFTYTPPGARQRFNVGNHGGYSRHELEVPLYILSGQT